MIGRISAWALSILFAMILLAGNAIAQPVQKNNRPAMDPDKARVVEHWTKERLENAIPRDLVIDPRGLGYMRMPNGFLEPYGHEIAAEANSDDRKPFAKPPSGNPGPSINDMDPGAGATIGSSYTFSATVTDVDEVKSVSFTIRYPDDSTTQSFNPSQSGSLAVKIDLPPIGPLHSGEDLHERALASAVFPDHGQHLASAGRETYPVKREHPGIPLGHLTNLEEWRIHGVSVLLSRRRSLLTRS